MAPILVGREPEVAAVARFPGRARQNSCVMLVEGEMGTGKTSVLAAAREAAREHGWLVLLSLTPAEQRVADLVVLGHSNARVASELFMAAGRSSST